MEFRCCRRVIVKAVVLGALVTLGSIGPVRDAWAQEAQKRVLAIYSMRREAQFPTLGDKQLPRLLRERLGAVDFYSEYLDLSRFPDPGYDEAMRDYFALKYEGRRFDLVVALQDVAAAFVERNRAELFPGARFVFLATNPPALPYAAGVRLDLDFTKTLTLATKLQPEIQDVFVVSGASSRDTHYENMARTQLAPFEKRLRVHYLSGLPTSDLEERLQNLPERSIVYYLLFYQDGRGVNLDPLDYLERLSSISNRPVYCWSDGTIGRGVVGGSLRSAEAQIEGVAAQAVKRSSDDRSDALPILVPERLFVDQVDWRQLQRWRIPEERVPEGTIIRFREPGAWERYRTYILGAAALVLLQTALIAALLIQRTRRRRAEEQVRRTEMELRGSYERIQDLGGRLLSAQDSERSRIARELHDDVSQQIAVVVVQLELIRRTQRQVSPETERLIRETLDRVNVIATTVHNISHRLHPARLRLIGLVPALGGLARELSSAETAVTFSDENIPETIAHDVALCIYRVAQEALQNATRHGGAQHVSLRLGGGPQGLVLVVSDDGRGFDVNSAVGRGLGLISMRERVEAFNGTLSVESEPGVGTRIVATVPLLSKMMDDDEALEEPA